MDSRRLVVLPLYKVDARCRDGQDISAHEGPYRYSDQCLGLSLAMIPDATTPLWIDSLMVMNQFCVESVGMSEIEQRGITEQGIEVTVIVTGGLEQFNNECTYSVEGIWHNERARSWLVSLRDSPWYHNVARFTMSDTVMTALLYSMWIPFSFMDLQCGKDPNQSG